MDTTYFVNKQNMKLSHSCVLNMVSITAQHNKKALKRLSLADIDTQPSNCLNKRKFPLERIAVSGVKRQNDVINSQFTCPKNMNSFQAVLFFC